nr:11K protein [Menippe mercenaria nudivirus]
MVTNVTLHNKINVNEKIDYDKIFPHFMLFGDKIKIKEDTGFVQHVCRDENTIRIGNMCDDLEMLFSVLQLTMKRQKPRVIFLSFDEDALTSADIGQILENIAIFIRKRVQNK